jgi:hypothetical protein
MTRGQMWVVAFAVVAMFVVAGAVFDDQGQRTWAVVSTIAVIGVAVVLGIGVAVSGVERLRAKVVRLKPRGFRRR